jgi:hypothetical protein
MQHPMYSPSHNANITIVWSVAKATFNIQLIILQGYLVLQDKNAIIQHWTRAVSYTNYYSRMKRLNMQSGSVLSTFRKTLQ